MRYGQGEHALLLTPRDGLSGANGLCNWLAEFCPVESSLLEHNRGESEADFPELVPRALVQHRLANNGVLGNNSIFLQIVQATEQGGAEIDTLQGLEGREEGLQLVGGGHGLVESEQLIEGELGAADSGAGIMVAQGGGGDAGPVGQQVEVEQPEVRDEHGDGGGSHGGSEAGGSIVVGSSRGGPGGGVVVVVVIGRLGGDGRVGAFVAGGTGRSVHWSAALHACRVVTEEERESRAFAAVGSKARRAA